MTDNYWEERSLEQARSELLSAKEYERQFKQRLSVVQGQIIERIDLFVEKYARRHELSIESAEKQLIDSHEWRDTLEEWKKMANDSHYPELFKEYMDIEFAKSQASRMESLLIQTKLMMADFAEQETPKFQDSLEKSYESTYYKSTYNIQNGLGTYQANFQQVSKADLSAVVNQNWQSSNFSKRLWGNMVEEIPGTLDKVLSKGVALGYSPDRMTREAKQVFKNANDYQVHRLILTEKRHISEEATMSSYKDQDVAQYRYLATLEKRTCSICGGLDHEIFKVSDIKKGRNYPLIHPHCRCTTTPYFDGIDEFTSGKRWSRNPLTDEKELVDRMDYSEWMEWLRGAESQKLIGQKTSDGIKINNVSKHIMDRTLERGEKTADIIDAINNPLKISDRGLDENGRHSIRYTGEKVQVLVNPVNGTLVTTFPTSHKLARRLRRHNDDIKSN
ncbi:minor capsid protein [Fructobacillus tropaeoli]|uniref:Phage head morphogenesis domain-containing protein n=1 Tax=Fructobacillus tropaeoli TaxID=709323 RepID=A0A3F3HI57_9LACO|nr:minor capsid protein [Fructobacillus tropaeoli]GAP04893.1 hypothetical protein FTRO_0110280 [Fructobacillus tropaeoli]